MISSTSYDLPQHRAEVREACLAAGVFPLDMKYLPNRDASGAAVSLEMVDKADIYIGIFAWRYGSVPKRRKISITEMEFNRAVERQKEGKLHELLIFTAHEDHLFSIKDIEVDATAQEKLAKLKIRACKGRGRKQFVSAQDLRRLVNEALPTCLKRYHDKQETAAAAARQSDTVVPAPVVAATHSSIPHNLPALGVFFGRVSELQKIADALAPASRTWGVLISGLGGMGKTSLAVGAAYAASPEDFKRIIFVSLKSRELDDDGERDLSGFMLSGIVELFGELARQMGREDLGREATEDTRPHMLLKALEGTQTLLVLDNLESLIKKDRDTVFTFVKSLPAGCRAILTSRTHMGTGAEELILEKIDEDAALETLRELGSHNRTLAQTSKAERLKLYRETEGTPLLLRWTAGQIGRGHCVTVGHAIAYLRSCPPENDPLDFIFGDLVADFKPEEIRVLCALTYFTLPARLEDIAAIVGMGRAETERVLNRLVNLSLAVPSDELQTFLPVPMVADFLRDKKPAEMAETGGRLEQHAHALIMENGDQKHERFPFLDAAWSSVSPAMPRFLSGPNERLQEVLDELTDFLDFMGRWDEWLALCQQAEARAVEEKDYDNAGRRAYQAGWVHYLRQQADAVLDSADRAAGHWEKAFPPGNDERAGTCERASAIRLHGIGYRLKKDYLAAIEAYREGLDLHRSLSAESEDVASALNDLAEAERLSGDLMAAERDFSEALRVAHVVNDAEGIALYTSNLAELALNQQKWPLAEELARKALPLCEKVGRKELIADACHYLAEALVRQERGDEGMPYGRRAVEIYQGLGSPKLAAAQATLDECAGMEGAARN